jgi:hypothetical protein
MILSSEGKHDEDDNLKDKEEDWRKILIRDEFLKLYFDNLGVNDRLYVERFTNFYDIQRKKNKEKFLFAIIKTKVKDLAMESEAEIKKNEQIIEMTKEHINKKKIFIMYPHAPNLLDDSINFLSLCYSGFANIDEKASKLFKIDSNLSEDTKPILKDFLQHVKKTGKFQNLDYNDNILKTDQVISKEHNKYVQNMFGDRLDKLIQKERSPDESYSLFLIKGTTLFEFKAHSRTLVIVGENISDSNVREQLLEHLVNENDKKKADVTYKHDCTIFSELEDQVADNFSSSSEGILLITILSLLFVINFFIVVPQNIFFGIRDMNLNFFETSANGNSLLEMQTLADIKHYWEGNVYDKLYDMEANRYNNSKLDPEASSTNSFAGLVGQGKDPSENYVKLSGNSTRYYIQNNNLFCGLMLNFKFSTMISRNDSTGGELDIRNSTEGYFEAIPVDQTESFASYEYGDVLNNLYPDSYEIYIKPTLNINHREIYKQQILEIFDPSKTYEFAYTLIIYNAVYDLAYTYSVDFQINSFGNIITNRWYHGYLPFITQDSNTYITLLVINIVYLVLFIYVSFSVIRTFSNRIFDLVRSKHYSFEFTDWIDLIGIVISFISQIIFYQLVLFSSEKFPIVMDYSEQFGYWVDHSISMKNYQRVTGIAMFFIMVRFIRFMYVAFPNFGVVFQTMGNAQSELLSFMLIVFSMLIGLSMMSHVAFAWYSPDYFKIEDAVLTTYLMFLGIFDYNDLISSNIYNPIAPVYFIIFMITFNMILINVFLCIIRNNYSEIKEKKDRFNQAYSLMVQDQTKEFQDRLMSLLVCKHPLEIEREAKVADAQKKDNKELEEEQERIYHQRIKSSEVSLWHRFKYNFERLNLKKLVTGSNWDREEFERKKTEKYKVLRKMNVLDSLEELEVDFEKEFGQLIDTFRFIIFIIVFVLMIYYQMRIGESPTTLDYVDKKFNSLLSYLSNFKDYSEVKVNIESYLNTTYCGSPKNCKGDEKFDPFIFENFVMINPPYTRLTFRVQNYIDNQRMWEKDLFPLSLANNDMFDYTVCPSASEWTKDPLHFESSKSKNSTAVNLHYYTPGSLKTADSCGGFVFLFNETYFKSDEDTPEQNYTLISNFLFERNLGSVVLDTAIFSLAYEYAVYLRADFIRTPLGSINYYVSTTLVPINRYKNSSDFSRLIIELIYYIFIIYYFFIEFSGIYFTIKNEIKLDFEKEPHKEKFMNSSAFNRFFRLDMEKYENEGILKVFCTIFFKLIEKTVKFVYIVTISVISYVREDYFKIIDLFSIAISISMFGMWLQIIVYTSQIKFVYFTEPKGSDFIDGDYSISIVSQLALYYRNYILWQALNSFLIFIRMLTFFKFSKSIYSLILVIKKARYTIIFHLILVLIINIGFILFGYAVFGQNFKEYMSFASGILQILIILGGRVSNTEFIAADSIFAYIYLITFTLLNYLIFFNLLNAIIIESYREIKHKKQQNVNETTNSSLIDNIILICKEKNKLFMNTCELYYKNIMTVYTVDYIDCTNKFNEAKYDLDNEEKVNRNLKRSWWKKWISYITLLKKFMDDISNKSQKCAKATLEGKFIDETLAVIYEDEKINTSSSLSIWAKIMTYIADRRDDSSAKYHFTDLHYQKEITKTQTIRQKATSQTLISDEKSENDETRFRFRDVKEKNEYMESFIKNYKEMITEKGHTFFRKKLFEKPEKDLRFSKGLKSNSNLISFEEVYYVGNITENDILNKDYQVFCCAYPECQNHPDICQCNLLKEAYECLSITIYDLLIKNFFIPHNMTSEEKEIYNGHYLYQFFIHNKNKTDIKYLPQIIPKQKIRNFEKEILFLRNMEDFFRFTVTDIVKNKDGHTFQIKKERVNKEEVVEMDEEQEYYRLFTIWNTLYIILFKKSADFVRNVRNKSTSAGFYIDIKQNLEFKQKFITPYKALLINYFHLEDPFDKNFHENNLMFGNDQFTETSNILDVIKFTLKQGSMDGIVVEEEKYNAETVFYSQHSKYLMEENEELLMDNPIMRENIKEDKNHNADYYPPIFSKLWQTFTIKEKFSLMYGYNSIIHDEDISLETLIKNDFLSKYDHKLDTFIYFTASHRAEMLKILEFPKDFTDLFISRLKNFVEKNNILDNQKILEVKTMHGAIKYIHDLKLNYVKYLDFVNDVLNRSYFKRTKEIMKTLTMEFTTHYKMFMTHNDKYMRAAPRKLEFVRFFEILLTKTKFNKFLSN